MSETMTIELDEVKADPKAWRTMGELVTEQLDYQTGKFYPQAHRAAQACAH